jgi:hypothetical protein
MKEEDLYTGAIIEESKPHEDYQLAMSGIPFNWNTGYHIAFNLKPDNQFQSYSCGPFACAYYKQVLQGKNVPSKKFVYSQTVAPGGGTASRTLGSFYINKGVCEETLCVSFRGNGTTDEQFMTDRSNNTSQAFSDALTNKIQAYAYVKSDIESVAQAIRDNNGCIIGIRGKNNGTWLSDMPLPPDNNDGAWGHWVYGLGAEIYKGKKCIKILNSWGPNIGIGGFQYIPEEYFYNSVFEVWTMTQKDNVIIPVYKHLFTKSILFGQTSTEVTALQRVLAGLGYSQPVTGFYGPVTSGNVMQFQRDNSVASEAVIVELQGHNIGPATRLALNTKQGV